MGGIILKCGLYSNGAAISRKDWDELVLGNLRTALGDAEGYSLRIAFVRAIKWAREVACQNELAFVFDRRPEREHEGKRIFELFERFSKLEAIGPAPVSITFSDSHRVLPLQAADLLAWEQYRYAVDYLRSAGKTKVAIRKELQRLSKGGRIVLRVALRPAIKKMVGLEIGNEEQLARAADLITSSPEQFAYKFSASPYS